MEIIINSRQSCNDCSLYANEITMDTMSEEQKDEQKAEMKEKWKGLLTLSPEEKKQKLEEFAQTVK